MRQVFNDIETEALFRRQGYVILKGIDNDSLLEFKSKALKLKPSDNFAGNQATLIRPQSVHITFFDENEEYKRTVYNHYKKTFTPLAKEYLKDYKCAQANVFLKPSGSGYVYPHQNLTIVDEEKFTTVSFWIPLQDTDFENGTICLIPGSHNNFIKYRNTHVHWPYMKLLMEDGLKHFVPIEVKAGELLVLDDRIIHYTPINSKHTERWVIHGVWAPKEAQLIFCDPVNGSVTIFPVHDEFWQFHTPGALLPETQAHYSLRYDLKLLSDIDLLSKLNDLKVQFNHT